MKSSDAPGPLFFILGHDHGLLVDAMLFLQGTDLVERSVLLLPPVLYEKNRGQLGIETLEYRCFEDLVDRIEERDPAVVFLFSGYLFTVHKLLSRSELDRLVG